MSIFGVISPFVLEFYLIISGLICIRLILSGLLCDIQCWIWTKYLLGINFKIWGSETAEGLVMINILRDSLYI